MYFFLLLNPDVRIVEEDPLAISEFVWIFATPSHPRLGRSLCMALSLLTASLTCASYNAVAKIVASFVSVNHSVLCRLVKLSYGFNGEHSSTRFFYLTLPLGSWVTATTVGSKTRIAARFHVF